MHDDKVRGYRAGRGVVSDEVGGDRGDWGGEGRYRGGDKGTGGADCQDGRAKDGTSNSHDCLHA